MSMARNSFSFTVFGFEPRPQGSKRYVGQRTTAAGNKIPLIIEASPGLPVWRRAVADAVKEAKAKDKAKMIFFMINP